MNDGEERLQHVIEELRDRYNAPPEPPREAMWTEIRTELASVREGAPWERRQVRSDWRPPAWTAWAAATSAVLLLGVSLGRITAPSSGPVVGPAEVSARADRALRQAAVRHLEGTETLLTLVRSDARSGELRPEARALAGRLLMETRLFLDVTATQDAELRRLMEDLELVLAQVISVESGDERSRTELELAVQGLETREVLPRIRVWSGGSAGT